MRSFSKRQVDSALQYLNGRMGFVGFSFCFGLFCVCVPKVLCPVVRNLLSLGLTTLVGTGSVGTSDGTLRQVRHPPFRLGCVQGHLGAPTCLAPPSSSTCVMVSPLPACLSLGLLDLPWGPHKPSRTGTPRGIPLRGPTHFSVGLPTLPCPGLRTSRLLSQRGVVGSSFRALSAPEPTSGTLPERSRPLLVGLGLDTRLGRMVRYFRSDLS